MCSPSTLVVSSLFLVVCRFVGGFVELKVYIACCCTAPVACFAAHMNCRVLFNGVCLQHITK